MGNILHRIIEFKKLEIERRRNQLPIEALRDTAHYHSKRRDFCRAVENSPDFGIIAEFKRKSPSQSEINTDADPAAVGRGYVSAGAAAISCLTDTEFFGAKSDDIDKLRAAVDVPILRKDFIINSYQLHETKAMGADAVLLIASVLTPVEIDALAEEANDLGLQVICEVHDEEEVAKISPSVDIIGVNNRNLGDFSVNISRSLELAEMLPPGMLRISESGIDDPQSILKLQTAHYRGFLVGTHFMRQPDPGQALASFIKKAHEIKEIYKDAIA